MPALDAVLQAAIDGEQLAGVSHAVFRRDEVLARNCLGWVDRLARDQRVQDPLWRPVALAGETVFLAALNLGGIALLRTMGW